MFLPKYNNLTSPFSSNYIGDIKKNIYPTSVNNEQCISKCIDKNIQLTHPITLETVTNIYHPFCAIVPQWNNGILNVIDKCNISDNVKNEQIIQDDKINILYPIINFNPQDFLSMYYGINDANDFYILLKNTNLPIFTKIRLFDCFINIFGEKIALIDNILSDTLIEIIKKFWIKKMYRRLCNYINITNGECHFINPDNNQLKKTEYIHNRTKYIMKILITQKNIFKICNNFFSNIKKNIIYDNTDSYTYFYTDNLFNYLTNALIEYINNFIKN